MKRFEVRAFIIGCILTCLTIFISPISGLLSDVVSQSFNISTSKIQIEVTDFKVKQDTNAYSLGTDGQFEPTLIQNEVMSIEFTLNNLSPFDVDVEGTIELSFVNEAKETQIVTLYTGETSDASIKAGELNGLIIGEQDLDTQELSATSNNRTGISKQVLADTLTTKDGLGEGFKSKRYTYKLYLDGNNVDKETLISTIKGNKIGVAVNVLASPQNKQSTWQSSVSTYGEIKTGVLRSLTFNLTGDNPLYVSKDDSYLEPGWVAQDEYDDPVSVDVSGQVEPSKIGEYTLEYTANYYGELHKLSRTVIVTDRKKPVLRPYVENPRKFVSETIDLRSFVLVDDGLAEPNLKDKIVITTPSDYDPMKPGKYNICYNVTNDIGMKADELCINLTVYAYKEIAPMYDTTIALSTDGHVYTWGYSGNGETGRNTTQTQFSPGEISGMSELEVVQIDGGQYFGMVLTADNRIFVWGYDGGGVQGNGVARIHNHVPKELVVRSETEKVKFVQISCSQYTAAALTEDGVVYIWGDGDNYASGNNSTYNIYEPQVLNIPGNPTIKFVNLGVRNGVAIDTEDNVYFWGQNGLGVNNNGSDVRVPTNVNEKLRNINVDSNIEATGIPNIKEISLGTDHGYILMNDGRLYAWGENDLGQLGNNTRMSVSPKDRVPQIMTGFGDFIDKVEAGENYGVALDRNGIAYVWGYSAFGSIGVSNGTVLKTPTIKNPAGGRKITSIGAYYATTGLITEDGYLYMSGSNDFGELGIGKTSGNSYEFVKTLHPE